MNASPLERLSAFVEETNDVHAIVDTPQGSQNKFKYNAATGLFQLGSGVHFSVLRDLGFSAESLRQAIAAEPPVGTPSSDGPQFDLSATTALDRAADEARAMQHTYTGTEHILLALLSEDSGGAAHLLASHAVDTARARQIILREYGF